MDSDESYHSKKEFYDPNEMTNDKEKENAGSISTLPFLHHLEIPSCFQQLELQATSDPCPPRTRPVFRHSVD